jgi:hypothetical protein
MKYKLLLIAGCLLATITFAQVPEDALKYSWNGPIGTARTQAIAGAAGSLGGDITSNFINPAGLAFYKTREFVLSPGFSLLKNKSNFRGTETTEKNNAFNLGTSGIVWGFSNRYSKWSNNAFSIAVARTANFNSSIHYIGGNNFSSYGERAAAEAASSGLSLENLINSNQVSIATRLASYTYLIDTLTIPGNSKPDVVSLALWNNLKNGSPYLVTQENNIKTKGGITEIALGYAADMDDKFYIGGSLGIPIVNYEKNSTFTERDATGNTNNNFNYSTLTEKLTTTGIGINAKLGIIIKPAESVRLGLAIHSPTYYGLKDTYSASMTTNTENYVHPNNSTITATSDLVTQGASPEYKYDLNSPWKVLLSGSYVLHEVADVKQQKGFITADIEYINYKSNNYTSADNNLPADYYSGVNSAIKDYYKSAFNFRVGGELKFTTIMARLGFAYYGNPYKDTELKGRKMFASGGLGYRNKGFFVDLTYVLALNRDADFPYRLPDKANTFAAINGTGGNIAMTFGVKF